MKKIKSSEYAQHADSSPPLRAANARTNATRVGRTTSRARAPRLSADWKLFAQRLAEHLPALAPDQFLILSVPNTHRFVQFAPRGSFGVRMEAVSNGYLDPDELLSDAEECSLRALGWQEPTVVPDEDGLDEEPIEGSPNWFRDVAAPVEFAELAMLAVRTFTGPYGVRHPSLLQYYAFANDGPTILLPGLGIPAESPPLSPPRDDERSVRALVEEACTLAADSDVRQDDEVFVLEVDGVPFRVTPESDAGVVRLVCRLMPVDEIGGDLFELMNRLNARYLAYGYVFVRDGDVRWATELVYEPFSSSALVASLQRGAEIVRTLLTLAKGD